MAAHGRFELAVNARAAGPRLGEDVQKVIKAVKAGDWTSTDDGTVVAAGHRAAGGRVRAQAGRRRPGRDGGAAGRRRASSCWTPQVTAELAEEGVARDLVRVVQQARRDAGLDVSDRIVLTVQAPEEVLAALRAHRDFVAGETLADEVEEGNGTGTPSSGTVGDGVEVTVWVRAVR